MLEVAIHLGLNHFVSPVLCISRSTRSRKMSLNLTIALHAHFLPSSGRLGISM